MKKGNMFRSLTFFLLTLFMWSSLPLRAEGAQKLLILKGLSETKPQYVLKVMHKISDYPKADDNVPAVSDVTTGRQVVEKQKLSYTQQEIEMIAAVVMREVGHCSKDSKLAVTRLIVNRLEDGRFGESIYDVLHAKGQFAAIHNYYDRELPADAACMEAVYEALSNPDHMDGALYYCNPSYIDAGTARWFGSLQYLFSVDGQNYYR